MPKYLLFILVFFVSKISNCQVDTVFVLKKVLEDSQTMIDAFQAKDIDTFMDFIHPKIIELYGSRENFKYEMTKDLPLEIIETKLSFPKTLLVNEYNYQCVLEQKQTIKVDLQKMYTISSLVGISYDKGKTWYFIGVSKNSFEQLKNTFSELDNRLNIMRQTAPILID